MSENNINNNEDSNKEICPYCQKEIEDKEFDDHMMCHELENEEKSNNNNNNINQNNDNNINQNNNNINHINRNNSANINNNSNQARNNNGNFLTQIFDIFSSASQQNNSNNNNSNQIRRNNSSSNSNNNSNNNLNPFGLVSEIFKFAYNTANNNNNQNSNISNNNNNINNNNIRNTNPIQDGLSQIGTAISNISRTVTSLNELTRQFSNLSTQLNSNSNPNPNRNDNQAPPPININNNQPNPNNNNNNIFPPNIVQIIPPIIIGHPGHFLNPFQQVNNINIDAIMNLLPSSTITEKKENEGQDNNCIICIGDFEIGDKVTSLPCLHVFHTECIKSWLQSKNFCPVCKYNITEDSLRRGN